MNCSNRVRELNQSPIRKLAPYVDEVKRRGVKIYPLNMGQPDIKTPNIFFESIKDYKTETLSYTNSNGLLELREAISDYYKRYNIDYNADEILITNGGSEALQLSIMSICDVGDSILMIEPFYINYATMVKSYSVNIQSVICEEDNSIPSIDKLSYYVDSSTKAILLSNPNNPTGKVYSKEEVLTLCEFAIKHDLWIISDEVYREFIYDNIEFISFADIKKISDRLILIDSVSKKYSACGVRIGSIATKNKELIQHLIKLCQCRLCVPTLEQIGAISLYKLSLDYFISMNKVYENRRNVLCKELDKINNITYQKPKGAFYVIVNLPIKNADDFAKWVLTEFNYNNETILLCPAKDFYFNKKDVFNQIRIAYTLKESDLIKAVNILNIALKEYNCQ